MRTFLRPVLVLKMRSIRMFAIRVTHYELPAVVSRTGPETFDASLVLTLGAFRLSFRSRYSFPPEPRNRPGDESGGSG